MKRDLKGYVRIDGQGRIVPGSLVLRRKRPDNGHNGKFIQVQTYECCENTAGFPITLTPATLTAGQTYSIAFNSPPLAGSTIKTGVSTPANLVTYLTANYAANGTYVLSGSNIIYTPANDNLSLVIAAITPQTIALPTLTGPSPNYHAQFTFNTLTSADIDSNTTTGAALVTYLTTNYASQGTYLLNSTNVLFTPINNGEILALTAGA